MRRPEILRDTQFRRFYIGQLVSLLGDQASVLAIPLTAVLVLDAGPFQLGLLTAVGILPSLFFSLWAGAVIDRRGRRRQMMLVAMWFGRSPCSAFPWPTSLGTSP